MKSFVLSLPFVMLFAFGVNAKVYLIDDLYEKNDVLYDIRTDKPITGEIRFFYPNGDLEEEERYKNGKLDGIKEVYWNNGNLRSKGDFKNGYPEGLTSFYTRHGILEFEVISENGIVVSGYNYDITGKKQK